MQATASPLVAIDWWLEGAIESKENMHGRPCQHAQEVVERAV